MNPRETIAAFDSYLAARSHRGSMTLVGGAALALLGIIRRATRDCDVIEPMLDPALLALAQSFAQQQTRAGIPLAPDWLNNGPVSLASVLPSGWRDRVVVAYQGQALCVRVLGRGDLVASKLWALCDRGTDLADCVALAPSVREIESLTPWLYIQDLNPDWPAHVDASLADVSRRCRHEL